MTDAPRPRGETTDASGGGGRTDREPERFAFLHHPLLGTVVEVVVWCDSPSTADDVDAAVVAEIERREAIFSAYRPDSEFRRWAGGALDTPGPELSEVLALALDWQLRSDGAFNPAAGELTALWRAAEETGVIPSDDEIEASVRSIAEPRFVLDGDRPVLVGSGDGLQLNAIAKGHIVDAALAAALDVEVGTAHDAATVDAVTGGSATERTTGRGVVSVLVNAGGDLAHRGVRPTVVGIENPLRPYDNEPPVARLVLRDAGLATSGSSRRGFTVGTRRHSHVIDPRTGHPVTSQASISVVAPRAATADVVATVAGVLDPEQAVALVAPMDGVGCLVIGPDGRHHSDPTWDAVAEPADPSGPVVRPGRPASSP